MSKAFVREDADAPDDEPEAPSVTPGGKNYISPAGFARLKAELRELVELERPEVVRTVSWAASNGDRSENGDYIYGKRRLREIDRRVRFLIKRLENAEVVNSSGRDTDQIFFGARVKVRPGDDRSGRDPSRGEGGIREITILGLDEVDPARGIVSWVSPIAKALLKAREGDTVTLRTPAGEEKLDIIEVTYP
jgi:transcription elongation factor GreB